MRQWRQVLPISLAFCIFKRLQLPICTPEFGLHPQLSFGTSGCFFVSFCGKTSINRARMNSYRAFWSSDSQSFLFCLLLSKFELTTSSKSKSSTRCLPSFNLFLSQEKQSGLKKTSLSASVQVGSLVPLSWLSGSPFCLTECTQMKQQWQW